jgi:hypothetical protein
MNQPARNRIVINMGSPPPGSPSRVRAPRRWPKLLALFCILVVAFCIMAAAGGYIWWRHYQTTPTYSVALILDAAQRNDMPAIDKQMDNDEIAKNMVTSLKQKAESRSVVSLTGSLQAQIDNMLPIALPRLKQGIHDQVAKEIKEFAAQSQPKPFIVVALMTPSLVKVVTESDNATVTAKLQDRPIQLSMRRDGDRWKVTALDDSRITDHVIDELMKELPSIGQFGQTAGRRNQKGASGNPAVPQG